MSACYNLKGTKSPFDGAQHYPCDQAAVDKGGHSMCCRKGDECMTNGMCYQKYEKERNSNWFFRTACTDPTWQDPACPRICGQIEPDRNTGLAMKCPGERNWCCAYVGGSINDFKSKSDTNTTCCTIEDLMFKADDPIVFATASLDLRIGTLDPSTTPTASSLSIPLPNSSSEPTPSGGASNSDDNSNANSESSNSANALPATSSGMSSGAKIGVGVGVALGVLALLAIGAFFFIRRRKRNQQPPRSELMDSGIDQKQQYQVYSHHASPMSPPAEMPTKSAAYELPGEVPTVNREDPAKFVHR